MRMVVLIAFALVLSNSSAWAQDENPTTPGAIPDPSTYQGSTELQRQSDEQSQQGYQQQFGQPQQSYGGGYGGGYSGGGGYRGQAGPSRSTLCFQRIPRIPSLQPLAGMIDLGSVGPDSSAPFRLGRKPTPGEKILLRRWIAERHRCGLIYMSDYPDASQHYSANHWGWVATERLTQRLIAGQLTYGEFSVERAANSRDASRFLRSHGH